jgi:hypothetical protein
MVQNDKLKFIDENILTSISILQFIMWQFQQNQQKSC